MPQPSYTNICYLNKTRRRITEDCCNRFSADKESMLVGCRYQGKLEKYSIAPEMPLLVTKNMRHHNLFNNQECKINNFNESGVVVEDEEHNMITLKLMEFRDGFIPAFCCTVYKYQGGTIDRPYNIYDANQMDRKQMYTALSRTTKLEYIRIDKPARYYCKPKEYPSEVVNSYFNDDYHNGQVYEISFELIDKLYVGCSIRNLQHRLDEHINDKKSTVYKYRNMKPTILPIICCPCRDRKELNKVEAEHIHYYATKYGDRLLNKQHVSKLQPKPKIHHAEIENEQQLRQRLREKFGDKIKIKDDPVNKLLYYDVKIDGKRYATKARYNEQSKEEALTKITAKQQQLIDELTIEFN